MPFPIIKILVLSTTAFILAVAITPCLTHFLYKYRLGKKIREGTKTPIFTKLHKKKEGTPTMGGILIWGSVLVIISVLWLVSKVFPGSLLGQFNFLSRSQTLLPLGVLIFSALVGMTDDLMGVFKVGTGAGWGLRMRHRILLYTLIALVGAWWFYFKLDWDLIKIPFLGEFNIGIWYLPLFVFIIVASAFSANETDGLDGLAGGVLLIAFGALAIIAWSQGKIELACFSGALAGSLLAFLWFNIYPARFFMGDTGSMSLGVSLGVISILTNTVFILPLLAFVLVMESMSVIIQVAAKKIFGRKVFLSSPIHHHFEAKGWPETKVTQRFWIVSSVMAAIGLLIYFMTK